MSSICRRPCRAGAARQVASEPSDADPEVFHGSSEHQLRHNGLDGAVITTRHIGSHWREPAAAGAQLRTAIDPRGPRLGVQRHLVDQLCVPGMMTDGWRQRAEHYVGNDPHAWVAGLSERNDLPLLRAGDLADEILSDAASVTIFKVSERRATFSRANVLAEVHRQFHGVRFASPDDRIDVAERTADLAVGQSLLISAPELHFTPERLRRRWDQPVPGQGARDLHHRHPH